MTDYVEVRSDNPEVTVGRDYKTNPVAVLRTIPILMGRQLTAEESFAWMSYGELTGSSSGEIDLDLLDDAGLDAAFSKGPAFGCTNCAVVIYTEEMKTAEVEEMFDRIKAAAERAELTIDNALLVRGERYWPLLDEDAPAGGIAIPEDPITFAEVSKMAAQVTWWHQEVDALQELLGEEIMDDVDKLLMGNPDIAVRAMPREREMYGWSVEQAQAFRSKMLTKIRTAARSGKGPVGHDAILEFGLALWDQDVITSVWHDIDAGRLDGLKLWKQLTRALPKPLNAMPIFLWGWRWWRKGDRTRALVGAKLSHAMSPKFGLPDILIGAVAAGLNPKSMISLEEAKEQAALQSFSTKAEETEVDWSSGQVGGPMFNGPHQRTPLDDLIKQLEAREEQ